MKHILPMPPGVKWDQKKTPACVGFACTLAQMIKLYGLTNKWIPRHSIFSRTGLGCAYRNSPITSKKSAAKFVADFLFSSNLNR